VSRGCTVAEDFASLMMADILMMVDGDEQIIEGWCLMKLRSFGAEEMAMVALLSDFEEGSSKSHFPIQSSSSFDRSFSFLVQTQ
jgi:hypothetical protein